MFVYTPEVDDRGSITPILAHPNTHIKQPAGVVNQWMWQHMGGVVRDARRHHIEVFHGVSGGLPLRLGRKDDIAGVVTIHDLAFLHYPSHFTFKERMMKKIITRHSCKAAHTVIAISESIKNDLVEHFGVDAEKVRVIYPVCDKRFAEPVLEADCEAVRQRYRLPKRYLLMLASMHSYKNPLIVMRALKRITDKNIHVVMVGCRTEYYESVVRRYCAHRDMAEQLVHVSRAHAADMPALYAMAQAVVVPSHYEGFGLPVVEAQNCGIPVIAARGTSLEEAAGEGAIFVDPNNVDDMVQAITTVTTDEARREQLIALGKENVARFSREEMANELMEIYRAARHEVRKRKQRH